MPEIDFSMVLAPTDRSRAYLSALKSKGYRPAHVILLGKDQPECEVSQKNTDMPATEFRKKYPEIDFENGFCIEEFLSDNHWSFVKPQRSDVNTPEVADAILQTSGKVVVYSGYPGVIVRDILLDVGKLLLHVHPGKLPEFRGSTTIYYSLLAEQPMTFSAIALDKVIDGGHVIHAESHQAPEDRTLIDKYVDNALRARTLVNALGKLSSPQQSRSLDKMKSPETSSNSKEYFVIHPMLKHVAIMSEANGNA